MTSTRTRPAVGRLRGDEGAALVEAAFLGPIFLLMLLGLMDEGLLFRDYLTLQNVSTVGARTVAIQPQDPGRDFETLKAIRLSALALASGAVTDVTIYKATGGTDSVNNHAPCTTLSQTGTCNHYTAANIADTTTPSNKDLIYNCVNVPTSPSKPWCPNIRNASNANADYAGVWVKTTHAYVTKLFGTSATLTAESISRLEPQSAN
jgi:Flp pilus assembly protein TadG